MSDRPKFTDTLRAAASDPDGYDVGVLLDRAADRIERLESGARALAVERDGLAAQLSEARDDAAMALATMDEALRAMGQIAVERKTLKAEVDRLRTALRTLVRAYVVETVRPVPEGCLPDYRFRVVLGGDRWTAGTNAWFGERAAAEAAVLEGAGLPADILEGEVSRPGADPDEVVVRYDDSDPYAHWEC